MKGVDTILKRKQNYIYCEVALEVIIFINNYFGCLFLQYGGWSCVP